VNKELANSLQYFQVGTDDDGKIQYLKTDVYENAGCHWNDPVSSLTIEHIKNCYDTSAWAVTGFSVRTDTASNTYCRAPSKFFPTVTHKSNKALYISFSYLLNYVIFMTFIF
jgi:hypothetical protein